MIRPQYGDGTCCFCPVSHSACPCNQKLVPSISLIFPSQSFQRLESQIQQHLFNPHPPGLQVVCHGLPASLCPLPPQLLHFLSLLTFPCVIPPSFFVLLAPSIFAIWSHISFSLIPPDFPVWIFGSSQVKNKNKSKNKKTHKSPTLNLP